VHVFLHLGPSIFLSFCMCVRALFFSISFSLFTRAGFLSFSFSLSLPLSVSHACTHHVSLSPTVSNTDAHSVSLFVARRCHFCFSLCFLSLNFLSLISLSPSPCSLISLPLISHNASLRSLCSLSLISLHPSLCFALFVHCPLSISTCLFALSAHCPLSLFTHLFALLSLFMVSYLS